LKILPQYLTVPLSYFDGTPGALAPGPSDIAVPQYLVVLFLPVIVVPQWFSRSSSR
jgi:hypothetical protein